jgi:excinuclease ABC subunit C
MPISDLKSRIDRLPEQPGVYLFANAAGETIYVGKARSLRDRVRSYLGAHGTSPKTDALLEEAEALDVVLTDSVVEALALENNLIKQRMPRYNILLRDDKNYPYLQLSVAEAFPRILVTRRVERDGNVYAGPFMPASLARRVMSLGHRLFGIRSCNEEITGRRGRPCLEYDIKRCIAPCVESLCSPEEYRRSVDDARLFLEGRTEELVGQLKGRMLTAASEERFEEAAQLRDAARTVQTLRDRQQKMASVELGDRDAFGVKTGPAGATVQVFQVRRGRVVERIELAFENAPPAAGPLPAAGRAMVPAPGDAEVLQAAVQQFYQDHDAPPEVHLPLDLADAEAAEAWLGDRAGRKVRLVVPKRGAKRGLLDLAARNAAQAFEARFNQANVAHYDGLETLRAALALPAFPRRIECFDISTIQGRDTVASMVVCEDGRMKRAEYRKFRIRPTAPPGAAGPRGPDDFASMNQVVMRRYQRALDHGGPFPDLIVVDGGQGQLSAAYDALEELGLANLVAVGLAKKEELIYVRGHDDPLALPREGSALLLLQQIRDEAHRVAVTFHRQARRTRDLRSELDGVPGVGPRRRRALLTAFGSFSGVRRASREELAAVVGGRVADAVLAYLAASR